MRLTDPAEIRDALEQDYSDTFKELHGFRPRYDLSSWTNGEIYAEIQTLHCDVAAEFQAEVEEYPTEGDGWTLADREWEDREPRVQNDFGGSFF